MISDGLYALLAADAGVTAILGAARDDKTTGIFANEMPDATKMPAIVLLQVSGDGVMTMDGPSGFRFARWQVSCYAGNYEDAKRLQRAVRALLESTTGLLSDGTRVDNMQTVVELDSFEEAPFVHHAPIDFEIAYSDTGS